MSKFISLNNFVKNFVEEEKREKKKAIIYQRIYTGKMKKGLDWDEVKIEVKRKVINEDYKV